MSAPVVGINKKFLAVRRVIEYFIKGNIVTDDTVIHSLFDSIKLSFCSIDDIENVAMGRFVYDIANKCMDLDSSAVVFGLELAGWLGGSITYYRHFKDSLHHLFLTVWEKLQSETLCDVSITTALYESLTLVLKHEEGLLWIVSEKKMEDITCHGLRCLAGCSSIFLEKSVIRFLSSLIAQLEGKQNVLLSETGQIITTRILTAATENIRNHYRGKQVGPFVPGSLQLLDTLCKHSPGTSALLLVNHIEFCKYLLEMIGTVNARDGDSIMNIFNGLLKRGTEEKNLTNETVIDSLIQDIESKLSALAINGNILTAQKLATCCLQCSCSKRLSETCRAILVQPVLWILGDCVEQDVYPENVLQQSLSTRSRCTDAVCRSLNMSIIEPHHITKLLGRTVIYSACRENSNSVASSLLYKNRKIQRKCLEVLTEIAHHDTDDVPGLLDRAEIVVELFKEPDSETVIYTLCSQLLLEWLPKLLTDINADNLTTKLANTIQLHLSALQWELRDTTLELLGRIMEGHNENLKITEWIIEHRLHVHVWQCIQDGESYVRASAISAVYQLCMNQQLLTALVNTGVISDETSILRDIVNIVENDTEAFARRSAATFLFNAFKVKVASNVKVTSDVKVKFDVESDLVLATIIKATRDFDWEVKLIALDFISLYLQFESLDCSENHNNKESSQCSISRYNLLEMPEYAHQLYSSSNQCDMKVNMRKLNRTSTVNQVVKALIEALDDYDEKVSEKALNIFTDLQNSLNKGNGTLNGVSENRTRGEPVIKKRKLSDVDKADTSNTAHNSKTTVRFPSGNPESTNVKKLEHLNETHCSENDDKDVVETAEAVKTILDFDLSIYRARFEQVLDEASKLVSLVEDIVTAGGKDEEENAADCY